VFQRRPPAAGAPPGTPNGVVPEGSEVLPPAGAAARDDRPTAGGAVTEWHGRTAAMSPNPEAGDPAVGHPSNAAAERSSRSNSTLRPSDAGSFCLASWDKASRLDI